MRTNNAVLELLTPAQLLRFWSKVEKTDGCWFWRGAVHPNGYGTWTVQLPDQRTTSVRPHRVAWRTIRGPIPDGLVLDHLCRAQTCVNPDHLEAVSQSVNGSRIPDWTQRSQQASVVAAVLLNRRPEEVVAWWRRWLDEDGRGRADMERAALSLTVGLFAEVV